MHSPKTESALADEIYKKLKLVFFMFRTWGAPRQPTDTQDAKNASQAWVEERDVEQSTQSHIFRLTIFILVSHIKRSLHSFLFLDGDLKIDEKCLKFYFALSCAEHHRANIVNTGRSVELITITVSPSPLLLSLNRELFDFISSVIWIVASLVLRATLWRLMTARWRNSHKNSLPKELIQQKKTDCNRKINAALDESRTRLDIVARLLF